MAGLENNYSVAERVGSQEVCVAILDPQTFQLSGNARISFTITLMPGTASGKNEFYKYSNTSFYTFIYKIILYINVLY